MARRAGVDIRMQSEVTSKTIASEKPEILVVATGARPFIPKYLPGWNNDMVTDYDALSHGTAKPGRSVVVIGGQWLGMSVAEALAERGSEVTVINATDAIAQDLEYMAQQTLNARLNRSNQIKLRLNTNVERIEDGQLALQTGGEIQKLTGIDQVVFAIEREMDRSLIDAMALDAKKGVGPECYTIGDCVWPREPYDTIFEANSLARKL